MVSKLEEKLVRQQLSNRIVESWEKLITDLKLRERLETLFLDLNRSRDLLCSKVIRQELVSLDGIKNLRLYPRDLMITFNFYKAQDLSTLLNKLSFLGYPERGEALYDHNDIGICKC